MSWTHEQKWDLEADPSRVFRALTGELTTWFAEHAEPGSQVGAPFRFWGRHTLGMPTREQATQQLTRYEKDRVLAFTWVMNGAPSEVSWTVAPREGGSTFKVAHSFESEPPGPRARELVDDLWRLAAGNLMSHLAGGDGILLPDFADPSPVVHFSLYIDASPARVFQTITDPALVNQWFQTQSADVDLREGGRYATNWAYKVDGRDVQGGPTKILELVPGKKLVLDWPDWRGDASVNTQTITFELEPEGKGTRLEFTHAGFARAADISDYPFGWRFFLKELARVATGAGLESRV